MSPPAEFAIADTSARNSRLSSSLPLGSFSLYSSVTDSAVSDVTRRSMSSFVTFAITLGSMDAPVDCDSTDRFGYKTYFGPPVVGLLQERYHAKWNGRYFFGA